MSFLQHVSRVRRQANRSAKKRDRGRDARWQVLLFLLFSITAPAMAQDRRVFVVLDTSVSMVTNDPHRLSVATTAALFDVLVARGGGRVHFAACGIGTVEGTLQPRLEYDRKGVPRYLDQLAGRLLVTAGTDPVTFLAPPLRSAAEFFEAGGRLEGDATRHNTLFAITDGRPEDTDWRKIGPVIWQSMASSGVHLTILRIGDGTITDEPLKDVQARGMGTVESIPPKSGVETLPDVVGKILHEQHGIEKAASGDVPADGKVSFNVPDFVSQTLLLFFGSGASLPDTRSLSLTGPSGAPIALSSGGSSNTFIYPVPGYREGEPSPVYYLRIGLNAPSAGAYTLSVPSSASFLVLHLFDYVLEARAQAPKGQAGPPEQVPRGRLFCAEVDVKARPPSSAVPQALEPAADRSVFFRVKRENDRDWLENWQMAANDGRRDPGLELGDEKASDSRFTGCLPVDQTPGETVSVQFRLVVGNRQVALSTPVSFKVAPGLIFQVRPEALLLPDPKSGLNRLSPGEAACTEVTLEVNESPVTGSEVLPLRLTLTDDSGLTGTHPLSDPGPLKNGVLTLDGVEVDRAGNGLDLTLTSAPTQSHQLCFTSSPQKEAGDRAALRLRFAPVLAPWSTYTPNTDGVARLELTLEAPSFLDAHRGLLLAGCLLLLGLLCLFFFLPRYRFPPDWQPLAATESDRLKPCPLAPAGNLRSRLGLREHKAFRVGQHLLEARVEKQGVLFSVKLPPGTRLEAPGAAPGSQLARRGDWVCPEVGVLYRLEEERASSGAGDAVRYFVVFAYRA